MIANYYAEANKMGISNSGELQIANAHFDRIWVIREYFPLMCLDNLTLGLCMNLAHLQEQGLSCTFVP